MHTIKLELSDKYYEIEIGTGFFLEIPKKILSKFTYKKVIVITDDNVSELYLESLVNSFEQEGVSCKAFIVPAGEQSKSISQLEKIYSFLIESNISRKDLIITLGGGVVGDLGGFAAATYLRGVDFIQIPTTLLSQVDSSVGGKVAVNLPEGKNLIGNFYHPKAVYIDIDVLKTLPSREVKSGMAEVIKYAFIKDKTLFDLLVGCTLDTVYTKYIEIVKTCIEIKADVVQKDEKESYERMLLNFGHTVGHGIEKYFDYNKYTHGEAIGHGMYVIIEGLFKKKMLAKEVRDQSMVLLNTYDMVLDETLDLEKLITYIKKDKKSTDKNINVILIEAIGSSYIKEVSYDWLKEMMEAIC